MPDPFAAYRVAVAAAAMASTGVVWAADEAPEVFIKRITNETLDTIKADKSLRNGDLAKLWDKWFMQPIPPKNARIGLAVSDSTKAAWANPNDKPAEDYARK